MPYRRRRVPRPRTKAGSQHSLDLNTEFHEIVAAEVWSYSGIETLSDLSVRLRVWAAELDRLASLGFQLRQLSLNCWAVEGPKGDETAGGDDESQE